MRGKGEKMAHFLEVFLNSAGRRDHSRRNARIALLVIILLALLMAVFNFDGLIAAFVASMTRIIRH